MSRHPLLSIISSCILLLIAMSYTSGDGSEKPAAEEKSHTGNLTRTELEKYWQLDRPTHLTAECTHGTDVACEHVASECFVFDSLETPEKQSKTTRLSPEINRQTNSEHEASASVYDILLAVASCLEGNLPIYYADESLRSEEMLNEGASLAQFQSEWRKFWLIDPPEDLADAENVVEHAVPLAPGSKIFVPAAHLAENDGPKPYIVGGKQVYEAKTTVAAPTENVPYAIMKPQYEPHPHIHADQQDYERKKTTKIIPGVMSASPIESQDVHIEPQIKPQHEHNPYHITPEAKHEHETVDGEDNEEVVFSMIQLYVKLHDVEGAKKLGPMINDKKALLEGIVELAGENLETAMNLEWGVLQIQSESPEKTEKVKFGELYSPEAFKKTAKELLDWGTEIVTKNQLPPTDYLSRPIYYNPHQPHATESANNGDTDEVVFSIIHLYAKMHDIESAKKLGPMMKDKKGLIEGIIELAGENLETAMELEQGVLQMQIESPKTANKVKSSELYSPGAFKNTAKELLDWGTEILTGSVKGE